MGITVHFHAAADSSGHQNSSTAMAPGSMDAGAAAGDGTAMATAMADHVDSPASALNAGGPPAALVDAVEAAFGRGKGSAADGSDSPQGNDGGSAPV